MPELPEVETVKRIIEPQITGRKILSVIMNNPQVIAYPDEKSFTELLLNQTVKNMSRRGKFLTIHFESDNKLILHLRMTGQLLVTPNDYPIEKHTHLILNLSDRFQIRYIDVRRFGRFWLIRNGEIDTYSGMEKLGLEPTDRKLTVEYLKSKLGNRRKTIKECLLEQSVIAGIGNIYSDEILFESQINPSRSASNLTMQEWEKLAETIPEMISYFIEKNAITTEEYLYSKGKSYRNTPFLKVYGHDGEPCQKCGKTLCRVVISGRSSVYCPDCQKIP